MLGNIPIQSCFRECEDAKKEGHKNGHSVHHSGGWMSKVDDLGEVDHVDPSLRINFRGRGNVQFRDRVGIEENVVH